MALTGALIVTLNKPQKRSDTVTDTLDTLVGPRVAELRTELNKVSELVRELEKDRRYKFGQLVNQLKAVGEQTSPLAVTTGQLREALASTRSRGAMG